MMAEEQVPKEADSQIADDQNVDSRSIAPVVEVFVPATNQHSQEDPALTNEYCGLSRSQLKIFAVGTALTTVILLCIATAPFCQGITCSYTLAVPVALSATISVVACSGMCVISPERHCCGCNRMEHIKLSKFGCILGTIFFFLAVAASYTWVSAMTILFLFFCTVRSSLLACCMPVSIWHRLSCASVANDPLTPTPPILKWIKCGHSIYEWMIQVAG